MTTDSQEVDQIVQAIIEVAPLVRQQGSIAKACLIVAAIVAVAHHEEQWLGEEFSDIVIDMAAARAIAHHSQRVATC
jgi:hypothetical protein